MITKNNFIVLTGGPGSGKTTLLNALRAKGFQVIGETGRSIIKERLANKLPPRPAPQEFAMQMFKADHQNFVINQQSQAITFFDRSFLDSSALLHRANPLNFEQIQNIIDAHRFNRKVFIAPPWREIYSTDEERDQCFADAVNTFELLTDWYSLNGYLLVTLPKTHVAGRVDFILTELNI